MARFKSIWSKLAHIQVAYSLCPAFRRILIILYQIGPNARKTRPILSKVKMLQLRMYLPYKKETENY